MTSHLALMAIFALMVSVVFATLMRDNPGDQLRFELEVVQIRGRICKMNGVAKVDGELVAEAQMAAMVRDR